MTTLDDNCEATTSAMCETVTQQVYCRTIEGPFSCSLPEGSDFFLCRGPLDAARVFHPMVGALGLRATIRMCLRQMSSRRMLYCSSKGPQLLSYGCLSIGFCRFYSVEVSDIVVGPVWTSPAARGQGYAAVSLMFAANRLLELGFTTLWVDTSEDNVAMQRVLQKCGFGEPVNTFERAYL